LIAATFFTIADSHSCSNRVITASVFSGAGAAEIATAEGSRLPPPQDTTTKNDASATAMNSQRFMLISFLVAHCCI
jgi:hypothetical protein